MTSEGYRFDLVVYLPSLVSTMSYYASSPTPTGHSSIHFPPPQPPIWTSISAKFTQAVVVLCYCYEVITLSYRLLGLRVDLDLEGEGIDPCGISHGQGTITCSDLPHHHLQLASHPSATPQTTSKAMGTWFLFWVVCVLFFFWIVC